MILINFKKSTFFYRRFSTVSNNDIELTINSSTPILNRLSELCITDFTGGTIGEGASLNRSRISYNHNNKAIRFDNRSWAFIKVSCDIISDDKTYNSVACPLFGISNLVLMKDSDSAINPVAIRKIVKDLGITPLKPESSLKTYAGLLTESQVALIFEKRPFDFDVDNYNAFCKKFKYLIEKRYSGRCLPMFVLDDITINSNFERGLITTVLQKRSSQSNTSALIADFSNITSSNIDIIGTIPFRDVSIFSHECVVYCIRYAEHPNYYRMGFVYDNTFITRLKQHATKTGLKPIVVFAFEQVKNFTTIHPEQLEIDLQQVVANDLVDSKFFNEFDLNYVRKCGDEGFYYNGSESDITRICFQKSSNFLIDSFLPLSTGIIAEGNRHLQK